MLLHHNIIRFSFAYHCLTLTLDFALHFETLSIAKIIWNPEKTSEIEEKNFLHQLFTHNFCKLCVNSRKNMFIARQTLRALEEEVRKMFFFCFPYKRWRLCVGAAFVREKL